MWVKTNLLRRKSILWANKSGKLKLEESKKKNSRIFLIYFTVLVYVLITTGGITDIQLILDDAVVLPIIDAKVSNTVFFLLSPLIVFALFVFYNLHNEHLKSKIQNKNWPIFELAKFPGSDKKTKYFVISENIFSTIFLWGLFPITLFVIAFRYLESHNSLAMWYHFIITFLGTIIAFIFWKNKKYELKQIILSEIIILLLSILIYFAPIVLLDLRFGRFISDSVYSTWDKDIKLFILFCCYIVILPIVVTGILNRFLKANFKKLFRLNIWLALCTIPLVLVHYIVHTPLGEGRNVDLSYQIIAQDPGLVSKGIYSADLRFKHLENASFLSSFLNNADMRYSFFNNATFHSAKLNDADLRKSDLRNVTLIEATLGNANLEGVDLSNSNLFDAELSNSNLKYANFTNCNLRKANLMSAIMDSTDFTGADLREARLNYVELGKCLTLFDAKLDSSVLDDISMHFNHLLSHNSSISK